VRIDDYVDIVGAKPKRGKASRHVLNRKLDGLVAPGRRKENALAHAQPAVGQKMHLHGRA